MVNLEFQTKINNTNCIVTTYVVLRIIIVQWKPLNVITDNVFLQFMITQIDQVPNNCLLVTLYQQEAAYCYHSVNAITLTWSQSDPIKWLPLFYLINPKFASNQTNTLALAQGLSTVGDFCFGGVHRAGLRVLNEIQSQKSKKGFERIHFDSNYSTCVNKHLFGYLLALLCDLFSFQ